MGKNFWRANALAALAAFLVAAGCSGQRAGGDDDDPAPRLDPGPSKPGAAASASDWSVEVRTAARAKGPAALEFVIESKRPIPARAADPVLLVGETAVRDYRHAGPDALVFTTTDLDALPERAEMSLGWATGSKIVSRGAAIGSFDKRRALAGQSSAPR
jgi:hypothetical protein